MRVKGETEEPEVSTRGQFEFDWACTWIEDGGHILGLPGLSTLCFRGCTSCVGPIFYGRRWTTNDLRQIAWMLKVSNKWSLL